jgi:hypothetical protein
MKPQVVAWELGKHLSDDAIVACDSGTVATWFARQIKARRDQMFSLSGTLASMANGLPYAIAAQLAYPQRQVVAFVGDGGFSMLMGELATAVKYRLPIKIVIVKNNSLGQIRWEQMAFLGNPNTAATYSRSTSRPSRAPAARPASPSRTPRSARPRSARPGHPWSGGGGGGGRSRYAALAGEDPLRTGPAFRRGHGQRRTEPYEDHEDHFQGQGPELV